MSESQQQQAEQIPEIVKRAFPAFELGKHMAKLTMEDEGVILLRPRYKLTPSQQDLYNKNITHINKVMAGRALFILMPHDMDVFVVEKSAAQNCDHSGYVCRACGWRREGT